MNDDLLRNHATFSESSLEIQGHRYRCLALPGVKALSVETLRKVRDFAASGGVVIELRPHYGGEGNRYPTGRQRFEIGKKAEPPPSGLLGPVRLIGYRSRLPHYRI